MAKLTLESQFFIFPTPSPQAHCLGGPFFCFQHLFVLLLTNLSCVCAWYVVNKLLKPYSLGS